MTDNILHDTLEVIEEFGWHKNGGINRHTGAVCGIGAYWVANGHPIDWRPQLGFYHSAVRSHGLAEAHRLRTQFNDEVIPVVYELFPERLQEGSAFPRFNDHPDTTLEDVVRVITIAADRLERRKLVAVLEREEARV